MSNLATMSSPKVVIKESSVRFVRKCRKDVIRASLLYVKVECTGSEQEQNVFSRSAIQKLLLSPKTSISLLFDQNKYVI